MLTSMQWKYAFMFFMGFAASSMLFVVIPSFLRGAPLVQMIKASAMSRENGSEVHKMLPDHRQVQERVRAYGSTKDQRGQQKDAKLQTEPASEDAKLRAKPGQRDAVLRGKPASSESSLRVGNPAGFLDKDGKRLYQMPPPSDGGLDKHERNFLVKYFGKFDRILEWGMGESTKIAAAVGVKHMRSVDSDR
jgi:hypothetical protein